MEVNPIVEKVYKMCVPDDHYNRIVELVNEGPAEGIYLKHKDGNTVRFYKQNDKIYSEDKKEDDTVLVQEVIKMSEIQQAKMDHSDFRKEVMSRIEKDNPDISQEDKDTMADILYEANESIKKLIASGIAPAVAKQIIEAVLNDKEIIDNTGGSAEALAASLSEKEKLFGNPKDDNYGNDE